MEQSVDVVVSELHSAAARLEAAAQRLGDGLSGVDEETAQLLGAGWKGGAASAYAPAWENWHGGAQQVVTGLQRMSELLTIAGKEYAKTDQSAAGALDSTMEGSGGSASGDGGSSDSPGSPSAGQGSVGADRAVSASGASQSTGSPAGMQQAMAAAMQLGQVAGQPLSHVGQVATGLAQQVTQLATAAAKQAEKASSTDGDEDQHAGEPKDAATPGERSSATAPTDSAPAERGAHPSAQQKGSY